MNLMDRFFSKVRKSSECWEWTGAIDSDGYGSFGFNGRIERAHRISYEIHNGHISKTKLVCHSCDNRKCVNPGHLWLGSNKDNMEDMAKKGRKIGLKGDSNGNSKLTWEIVDEIRSSPKPSTYFVKKYSISKTNVCDIRKNKTWRRV